MITRLSPSDRAREPNAPKIRSYDAVIRRFFSLIERIERSSQPLAPEVKARITRLDTDDQPASRQKAARSAPA